MLHDLLWPTWGHSTLCINTIAQRFQNVLSSPGNSREMYWRVRVEDRRGSDIPLSPRLC